MHFCKSPVWCEVISWTNDSLLKLDAHGQNLSEIVIKIQFWLKKRKYIWKWYIQNYSHFIQPSMYDDIYLHFLTHWGRVTQICISKLTIIGSDNGLSTGRRQAIIWTNAGILLIGPLGTNFIGILIGIHTFSFEKMHLKSRPENGGHFVSASMC